MLHQKQPGYRCLPYGHHFLHNNPTINIDGIGRWTTNFKSYGLSFINTYLRCKALNSQISKLPTELSHSEDGFPGNAFSIEIGFCACAKNGIAKSSNAIIGLKANMHSNCCFTKGNTVWRLPNNFFMSSGVELIRIISRNVFLIKFRFNFLFLFRLLG